MASAPHSEASPLLGRNGSASRLQPHQRYASSSTSPADDVEAEEAAESIFSHVSLDGTPTYGRLVAAHVLSLLPGLALQLAAIMLAFHAPCHVHYNPEDRRSDRKLCKQLLSDWMSLTAFTLGLVSWLAAYSFRPALLRIVEWCVKLWQSVVILCTEEGTDGEARRKQSSSSTFSTLLFVLLRTSVLESMRMFSIMVVNAVLFAGLAHLQDQGRLGKDDGQSQAPWLLQWYDPRFTVGLWVAIGWCLTEFVVSTFQMVDRLSLYEPVFEQVGREEETGNALTSAAYTPPAASSMDSHTAGEYTSDSATTVRAQPTIPMPRNKVERQQAQHHTEALKSERPSSPKARLLQARRLTTEAEAVNSAIESGISLAGLENEEEEQEMRRLKEQLDEEMDVLLKARMRDELQQTLGQPLTEVPIVLCALWRIDGWLWNLGATLLMSASVTLAQGPLTDQIPRLFPPFHLVKTTLFVLIGLHTLFTSLWQECLPFLGFAFVTYTSMLAGLGLCVSALGRWGLLV